MWQLSAGLFLGWSLGANDAANVFGTAVASRIIRFRTAAVLGAIFIIAGAYLEGAAGMETYSSLGHYSLNMAFIATFAAALTVTFMTYLGLPVSTSQAIVGAMVAAGLFSSHVNWGSLGKVAACWVGTPIGAAIISMLVYRPLGALINRVGFFFGRDRLIMILLVIFGSYGAYALGANNVANVTGAFVASGVMAPQLAATVGGIAIALGVVSYSYKVMMTVGGGIVALDSYSALVVVLAEAITVHIYAMVGVPVSTSQAVVGAVLGIGILKGVQSVNGSTLLRIVLGWVGTPLITFILTLGTVYVLKTMGIGV